MPAHYDFKEPIIKGSTWQKSLRYKQSNGEPYDLDGYSGKMQIRSPDLQTLILELSTVNTRMVIGASADPETKGWIYLTITAADTLAELEDAVAGSYRYDIELTLAAYTKTLAEGSVPIKNPVTE